MSLLIAEPSPPGYHLFDRLRAEYEAAWLEALFAEPQGFQAMAGGRSIVVFGEDGSGKTALYQALKRCAYHDDGVPRQLVVQWRPQMPLTTYTGSEAVQLYLSQSLDACAAALLRYLGRWPAVFAAVPQWVQEVTVWFTHRFLLGDLAFRLNRLEEECTPEGAALLGELASRSPREILYPDAPAPMVIAELMRAVTRLGLEGVWVMVDGLEPWIEAEEDALAEMLKALLSTLALYEEPGFTLKLMAPAKIEPFLMTSGGIIRRRLDVYRLQWPVEQLTAMVERRLALALDQDNFYLADLCLAADLLTWLEQYGGCVPRGWLELIRPLVEVYFNRNERRPLTEAEWMDIRRRRPPRLRIDLDTGQVFIGRKDVTEKLPPAPRNILLYLYQNRARLCTRSELYYRAHLGLEQEPKSTIDKNWEPPAQWGRVLDTLLWRLRKALEPDSGNSIYLFTERGRGIRLKNVW